MVDTVALVAGYFVVALIVVRWELVIRQRQRGLVALHTVAMLAVVGAWFKKGYPAAAWVNAVWLVLAVVWYLLGSRRSRRLSRRRRT